MRVISLGFLACLLAFGAPREARAIPYFAHEFAMTCQKCHSVVPTLNAFGTAFLDHGYQLPGARPQATFPVSARVNLAYSSEPDPTGLPKAIVDEVELFLAGTVGSRGNYFVEQYLVDGGTPGATRDAWFQYRFTTERSHVPVYLQAGSFTLPLPVDPETFRDTAQHYTIYDQTVGKNPFDFFDPKIGLAGRVGDVERGFAARILALQGHDKQSGLPALGIDTMADLQDALGPVTLSAYRYDGSRPVGTVPDRFWRQGYGVSVAHGAFASDVVLQTGHDSNADGFGTGALSSGGFVQLRYAFDRRLFGLVRYEGTNDLTAGFTRDLVPLLGYRVSRNARFTIEDVYQHVPQTKHTMNMQYTVAY